MPDFVLIDDGRPQSVDATVRDERVYLDSASLRDALGWELKAQGLCRGDVCIPVRKREALVGDAGIDLAVLAQLIDRPLALDAGARAAALGVSAGERARLLATLEAPDFTLPDLDGTPHSLSDYRGQKRLLLTYASWCGCSFDLPLWQQMHEELKDYGFTLISVALDKSADDARPSIEAAKPTHPALIDVDHRVADLYRMINVPTVVWIDEEGRIVRPNDVAFANDDFKAVHGVESGRHHEALRAWVKNNRAPLPPAEVAAHQTMPTAEEQLARTEYALAWHLHQTGDAAAGERHFRRAEELAPHDFTIRRGSMPIRGKDPFGADFVPLYNEWEQAGRPYYKRMR